MTAYRFTSFERHQAHKLADLEARVSPEPWSEALFAGELDVHTALRNWIVVHTQSESESESGADGDTAAGQLVGFGGMMFVGDEGHLMNIAIEPGVQGNGLATELLALLTTDAIERGCHSLTLEVRTTNDPAAALYRRFGYSPVGVRKAYYVDGADALIMWVHDVHLPKYRELVASLASPSPYTSASSLSPVVHQ